MQQELWRHKQLNDHLISLLGDYGTVVLTGENVPQFYKNTELYGYKEEEEEEEEEEEAHDVVMCGEE